MSTKGQKLLVWLPSPLGDAVLCTPALKAIRKHFYDASITFIASNTTRRILQPCDLCDGWIKPASPIKLAKKIKRFDKAILFKNSFGSALTLYLAGIPERIGYDRDWRGMFLTNKIKPKMEHPCKFKPSSMIDYYLKVCKQLGCDISDRTMELSVSDDDLASISDKFSEVMNSQKPLAIFVPGGAFGPSKCWKTDRFAKLADKLIDKYNANVVVSVAPNEIEKLMANKIVRQSKRKLFNLGDMKLSLGELKALFSKADIVITNDTGPRHIAIALKRKVLTMFGPNNPEWTQTGYPDETQICGKAGCVPCDRPKCRMKKHICMDSITVEQIFDAASEILDR